MTPPAQELTASPPLAAPSIAVPRARALWLSPATLVGGTILLLAALSFLTPSAPTYDPWAWIIWGREVVHLDLNTVNGPSWKPLPVMITSVLALTGKAAPDLWLFVARAGAITGVVMAFRVARRLGGGSLAAGVAAAVALALAPWYVRNAQLGNSEGLLVAFGLAAIDRQLAGERRAAFALGVGAALLRPEAWPLLGLYGLWLARRHRDARRTVAAGFAALPALWLLPELWGSGDLLRAAHRARAPNPGSAAFASDPVHAILQQFQMMPSTIVWYGALLLALLLVAGRPARRRIAPAIPIAGIALVWVLEVAYMTRDGFAGNQRYLIFPAALVCVLAGAGLGRGIEALGERVPRGRLATAVVAGIAALAVAKPVVDELGPTMRANRYQARLVDGLSRAVAQAGGPARLRACGAAYTGRYLVPAVAWQLHLHTDAVGFVPAQPAVVFREHTIPATAPVPALDPLGGEGNVRTLANRSGWRIVATHCGARP